MFKIGPPSSSGSESSSRDVSPSKGSEWSTTSEPHIEPKTPQRRAKSISSSDAHWSDDSDTPVKPRSRRRRGRFYTGHLSDERSLPASDERSLLSSDKRSVISLSDFEFESGSDSDSDSIPKESTHSHPDRSDEEKEEEELPFPFDNPEEWESQRDTRDVDPLKLGDIPVRPLPPVS